MYGVYRTLTYVASPFVPLLLKARLARGKEDGERLNERLGKTTFTRPQGKLIWIHAASVGEANAVLPFIDALLTTNPARKVLLTTVTVTSAELMDKRLPEGAIHQFAPVDTPGAIESFLTHWKPDLALWVDSELWPSLIMQTRKHGIVMGLINARMSERSFRRWHLAKGFIKQLLSCFTFCFAQSETDAARLMALGIPAITAIGNLKYNALPLPYDKQELGKLWSAITTRPVWLAASTHPGEETLIASVHHTLKNEGADILTIIAPRHAKRGASIAKELADLNIARRSLGEPITPTTDIYLADTMGELGLFYSLAPVVFIGGSLVAHGGQNPLEAARLGCAIIAGPHMENFMEITAAMQQEGACLRIADTKELIDTINHLLHPYRSDPCLQLAQAAQKHVQSHAGQLMQIMNELQPYLA